MVSIKKKSQEIAYLCQSCGHSERKWHGRCPACLAWNTMVEERVSERSSGNTSSNTKAQPITLIEGQEYIRRKTGIEELDRVLGGGLVRGGVTLIGGEPGSGKSTLLQMVSAKLAKLSQKVLYISGEESKEQIRLNAERLDALSENFGSIQTPI